MERSQVIARAALALRADYLGERAFALLVTEQCVRHICIQVGLEYSVCERRDLALGGAHASLCLLDGRDPEQGGMIYVAKDLTPEQSAFAVAHELGHLMLHRGEAVPQHATCDDSEVNEYTRPADADGHYERVEEYTPRARREFEANAFAAELLVPRAAARRFFASGKCSIEELAATAGITPTLAKQRRLDAVLTSASDEQLEQLPAAGDALADGSAADRLTKLNPSQWAAATAEAPALVLAGPGTGKTATLVGRVAYLLQGQALPEQILALTFSNEAAGEMRERLLALGPAGDRVQVLTIHAFAATLLRAYSSQVPCGPEEPSLKPTFRILDGADELLLLHDLADSLGLRHYRSFSDPVRALNRLAGSFSRARDELHSPADYAALVATMVASADASTDASADSAHGLEQDATAMGSGRTPTPTPSNRMSFTPSQIARATERAHAYARWTSELRQRDLLDYGSLIQLAVLLLQQRPEVLNDVRSKYAHVLVDEYQDTNRAAAELLMLLAGAEGRSLWVVGDPNQSVYRWRGASPQNLPRLTERYPQLTIRTLRECYRSVPALVEVASAIATRLGHEHGASTADRGDGPSAVPLSPLARAQGETTPVAVRAASATPALYRETRFTTARHEGEGIARQIRGFTASGYTLHQQAILCRTRKQAARLRAALDEAGIPVAEASGFFSRREVRVALALVSLAAKQGPEGLLCAPELLTGITDLNTDERTTITRLIVKLAQAREPFPGALMSRERLGAWLKECGSQTPRLLSALNTLGNEAGTLYYSGGAISWHLANFLMRPGGIAARLLARADEPHPASSHPASSHPANWPDTLSPAAARAALGALGELVALAARFDTRWDNEPGFKQRLLRATSQATREPADETDEREPIATKATKATSATPRANQWQEHGVPRSDTQGELLDADVVQPSLEVRGNPTKTAVAGEARRRPRCFLQYLRALVASDAELPVPSGEADAVRVLTLHRSKGLEFPIVYLPTLAKGQFPTKPHHETDPEPYGFREGTAETEQADEERNLFYVGVTRAQDALVLTAAQQYDKRGKATVSPLLDLLSEVTRDGQAAPLLIDGDDMAADAPLPAGERNGESAESPDRLPMGKAALASEANSAKDQLREDQLPIFDFAAIVAYTHCPRRFRYAYQYGLPDVAGRETQQYYRCLHSAIDDLHALRATAGHVPWTAAEQVIQGRWQSDGPHRSASVAPYASQYTAALRRVWESSDGSGPALALQAAATRQELIATLRGYRVRLTVNRVASSTSPSGTVTTTLIRMRSGRPVKHPARHSELGLELPLYALAYAQHDPHGAANVILACVGGGLDAGEHDAESAEAGEEPDALDVLDVTAEVSKCVAEYQRPNRKAVNRLDKLDDAAAGIAAGRFDAIAHSDECLECPYALLCPAEPLPGVRLPVLRREPPAERAPLVRAFEARV